MNFHGVLPSDPQVQASLIAALAAITLPLIFKIEQVFEQRKKAHKREENAKKYKLVSGDNRVAREFGRDEASANAEAKCLGQASVISDGMQQFSEHLRAIEGQPSNSAECGDTQANGNIHLNSPRLIEADRSNGSAGESTR